MIIYKPSLPDPITWCPTKNLGPIGSAVLTFIEYKQTNKQTDKPNLYIDDYMEPFKTVILMTIYLFLQLLRFTYHKTHWKIVKTTFCKVFRCLRSSRVNIFNKFINSHQKSRKHTNIYIDNKISEEYLNIPFRYVIPKSQNLHIRLV